MYLYSFVTPEGNGNRELKLELLDAVHEMIKHSRTTIVRNQILISGRGKVVCSMKDPEFYGK